MEEFIGMLHPPGWSIWQTIGTGATLTVGYALGKLVLDVLGNLIAKARK